MELHTIIDDGLEITSTLKGGELWMETKDSTTKVVFWKIVAIGLLFLGVNLLWLGVSGIKGEQLVARPFVALGFGLAACFLGLVILFPRLASKF
jgi:hypothetical protein